MRGLRSIKVGNGLDDAERFLGELDDANGNDEPRLKSAPGVYAYLLADYSQSPWSIMPRAEELSSPFFARGTCCRGASACRIPYS